MRTMIAALLIGFEFAGSAAAQDWYAPGRFAEGHASACLPSDGVEQIFTSLCVYVGCEPGEAASFGIGLQQIPLPPETRVRISVDGQEVTDLELPVVPGRPGGSVPLEGREDLLEALRLGHSARISIRTIEGWRDYEVRLSGAREAIDTALATCPVSLSGRDLGQAAAGRTSENPATEAIVNNELHCIDGVAAVEPGFVQQADVDGDGINDVLIDYLGLTCDGSRLFCGTGGCTQEIWLADPTGPYRLLLSDLIQQIEVPGSGRVRITMDGGDCGLSGAEVCKYDFRVSDGRLISLD